MRVRYIKQMLVLHADMMLSCVFLLPGCRTGNAGFVPADLLVAARIGQDDAQAQAACLMQQLKEQAAGQQVNNHPCPHTPAHALC